jgi:MoaA/NifB/PqqE/SkfB family radical SAM enzyme
MNIKGIHLELTNTCTLKCPACARTRFIKQFPSKWKNYSLNLADLKNFLDINLSGIIFTLCGTYGDPIYYPQLFELCKWLKLNNAEIILTTNGSYKSKEWWEKLATILDSNDKIYWSIDGLPQNFTQYRINGDWKSIETGIKIIAHTQIQTSWRYIVFKYNQDNIDAARKLSQDLNIKKFEIRLSDRWDGNDDPYMPTESYIKDFYEDKKNFKNGLTPTNIDPLCLNNDSEHYITADGNYVPCCYIADYRFYYKTQWGKDKNSYRINKTTISSLLQRDDVQNFYTGLTNNNFSKACSFNCGIFKN